jgi:hypothetical protein
MSSRYDHESLERRLACPFYRFDNHRYSGCAKFDLKSYFALQQHLERKHKAEFEFYCPHCYLFFETEESKNNHVVTASTQQPNCASTYRGHDKIPWPEWDRTFGNANPERRPRKGKNAALANVNREKWFWLWGQLFREHVRPPPEFVYFLDDPVEEATRQAVNQACIQSAIERYFAVNNFGRGTPAELAEQIRQELMIRSRPNPRSQKYRVGPISNKDNTSATMVDDNNDGAELPGPAADLGSPSALFSPQPHDPESPPMLVTVSSESLWDTDEAWAKVRNKPIAMGNATTWEQVRHCIDFDEWRRSWFLYGPCVSVPILSSQVNVFRNMGGITYVEADEQAAVGDTKFE